MEAARMQLTSMTVRNRKVKGVDRKAVHQHADEYLASLSRMSEKSTQKQAKIGEGILFKYAKLLANGLETMFSVIKPKI